MQTSIQSPLPDNADRAQSLIGQVFAGVVSVKKDESLIIAIADPNGEAIPVPAILAKDGLIGFTPTIKEQRFTLMENGSKLCVRITGVDLESAQPVIYVSEASSLR